MGVEPRVVVGACGVERDGEAGGVVLGLLVGAVEGEAAEGLGNVRNGVMGMMRVSFGLVLVVVLAVAVCTILGALVD